MGSELAVGIWGSSCFLEKPLNDLLLFSPEPLESSAWVSGFSDSLSQAGWLFGPPTSRWNLQLEDAPGDWRDKIKPKLPVRENSESKLRRNTKRTSSSNLPVEAAFCSSLQDLSTGSEGTLDMASEIHMPGPECLIENINGRLLVNPEALKILSAIRQPVVVVAIVGLYRTGKSYLMNKLAGKNKGFSLGSTVQSHTKGIWMWCVPHPKKPDHTLVLLDTEGLGDVEKGDNQNDSWIFALAVLLSSTFVYNSIGTINQQAMDQLHYVTELTHRIRAKSSPDKHEVQDSANFVSFFPDFVWTLRDFSLELEADGQAITADEYLENSLKLKQGNDKKTKNFNEPRLCIRKFFPEKKCFIFDRPAPRKYLIHLEQLQEEDLNPEFREQVADFCFYILSHSKAKTLSGGITVNGPRLESLVLTYVNSINSGDLPCLETAVLALAEIENLAAVQKAIAHYDQQMGQKLKLPTETLQELLDLHRATEKEAIEVFMKNSFKDVDQVFQKKLGTEETLRKYLDSKDGVADALLQTDQLLTEKEKEIEVERMKSEAAEAANKMLEEMQKKSEQMMQEKEASYQEHVKQLTEKMEKERAQLAADQERVLALKLQEQGRLLREGFQKESMKLQEEIVALQKKPPPCNIL
ncbi:TPA: hypothetical protein BOS_3270 [Bos taurus]|nr:TPA: hypothetical protein BOS_3270 [Bos taurus]